MKLFSALRRGVVFALLVASVVLAGVPTAARAQIGSDRYASMVVDVQTGQIISASNPDDYRFPASLTKLMTIYLVFEAIRDRRLNLTDPVPISAWAAAMPPTKLGLIPGSTLSVEQALLGLVTKSANDAAAALGEMLGGDEDRFAQLMTIRAHALGMSRTTFRNASGLPDWGQVTTARDLAVLARHLIQDFPQYYHYFSTPSFVFHGRIVPNHQSMLKTYAGADGLKTGYTEASGYNLVTSAVRPAAHGDVRLIGVVLGASNGWERDQHMAALLDQGFLRLGVVPLEMVRHEPGFRVPSLLSSAQAAPVLVRVPTPIEVAPPPVRWGSARRVPPGRNTASFVSPSGRSWPVPPRVVAFHPIGAHPSVAIRSVAPPVTRAVPRSWREGPHVSRQLYSGHSPS